MYKAVKNCGRIVEFAKQDEKTLMRWAAGILAREGRKITTRDMELFLTKPVRIWEISVWNWRS